MQDAGWCLTREGQPTTLYSLRCRALVAQPQTGASSACTLTPTTTPCHTCGRNLYSLVDIPRGSPHLNEFGLSEHALRLPFCPGSTCYATTYFELGPDGDFVRSERTKAPNYLPTNPADWQPPPANALHLGPVRGPLAAASWMTEAVPGSQLGGAPGWVQDPNFPTCPRCKELMFFVAQVAMQDVEPYGDGMYYGLLCRDCRISATVYQQT